MVRAIVVTGGRRADDMALTEVPIAPPRPGEVQVTVRYAGVNFMDVGTRRGEYRHAGALLKTPGVEGMGVIERVGSDASAFHIGQRVAWFLHWGSYAEAVNVPVTSLVPVPDGIDDQTAAAVMMQGLTAHHLATRSFPVQPGHVCLVHAGAGGVGQLLTQLISARGATVIARVSTTDKVERARSAGARHVLVGRDGDFVGEITSLTTGRGVDAVFDAVGRTTLRDSIASLTRHGTLVAFGTASGAASPIALESIPKSIHITYSTVMDHVPDHQSLMDRASEVFSLIAEGTLRADIGGIYSLADASRAHHDLESRGSTGKLLLRT